MKFKKLGISIKDYELYVDAECKLPESIKQIILNGSKALKEKKTKDSVSPQYRQGYDDLFNSLFKK
jgi:hypothetical protein